jgi:hypothetical protein
MTARAGRSAQHVRQDASKAVPLVRQCEQRYRPTDHVARLDVNRLLFPSPLHEGRISALMKVFGAVFDGILEKCRFCLEHEMQPIDADALELGVDDFVQ